LRPYRSVERDKLDDLAVEQRPKQLPCPMAKGFFLVRRLVAVGDELTHDAAAVGVATEHEEEHTMVDVEARNQPFGGRDHEALERFCVPADFAFWGALFHELLLFFRIASGFLLGAFVFDDVFRRLHDDVAFVVVTFATGATGDLAEIADVEDRRFFGRRISKVG